jgi:acetyl-CoA carboxylase biotin carboxylase subunit
MTQDDVRFTGHAIEVRVNAENPWTFRPSPGIITGYHAPGGPGVRIDAAVHENAMVQPFYDSLIAKLIVHAPDRTAAIRRILRAMQEYVVEGIDTTLPLQMELIRSDAFRDVQFYTKFIDAWLEERLSAGDEETG